MMRGPGVGIAALALGKQANARDIPLVLDLVRDENTDVRRCAALALGSFDYDQDRMHTITTKTSGWIEKAWVTTRKRHTGTFYMIRPSLYR